MIKEAYCSYEVAKLLKEKGFEGDINAYYHIWDNGNKVCSVQEFSHSEAPHLYIPTPTHQMALAWLREVHGLSVETFSIKGTSNICPVFWKGNVVKLLTQDRVFSGELVSSYEEAVEAALKYILVNLI